MSRDFDKAQEMVWASMEYVKVLGFRLRRTEGQRDDWKQVAQSHAEELIQCRQQIDVLKSERNAERKAHDEYKERNRELFNQKQRLTAELVVIKDERDALRAQIDTEREPKPVGVPRAHPVTVGEYVKRLTGFNTTPAGEIGRVTQVDDDEYEVTRPNGQRGVWCAKNCTPCEPPTAATHDTPEGKQAAESAVKRESDGIRAGDEVEVFQKTTSETLFDDISICGTVSEVFYLGTGTKCVRLIPKTMNRRSRGDEYFGYADVRKIAQKTAQAVKPKPGDTVRLARIPTSWDEHCGRVGDIAIIDSVSTGHDEVLLNSGWVWPISCIEIVEDAK